MDQFAQEGGAAAELSRHLAKGSTGRISVGAKGYELDVYVMNGQVVAAESPDDIKLILRRVAATGQIGQERAAELGGQADSGESIFGVLLEEVPEKVMETVLFDRFRDNLARYLGSKATAEFKPLGAIFVENFQMGHDTPGLLRECSAMWRQSQKVALNAVLRATHPEDATADQRLVIQLVDGRRTVRQLLQEVPLEPIYGRALVAQMAANGILRPADQAPPTPDEFPPVYEEASTTQASSLRAAALAARDLADTEVIEAPRTPTADFEDLPDEVDLDATEVVDRPIDRPEPPPSTPTGEWADFLVSSPSPDVPDDDEPDGPEDEDDDAPTLTGDPSQALERLAQVQREKEGRRKKVAAAAKGEPAGVQEWLSRQTSLEEDVLEAFQDHDYVRGSSENEGGGFSQEQEALDRVEVAAMAPASEPEIELEAEEAPHAKFGAKHLSDDQALAKIDVANQCVIEVISAFDRCEGPGRGRAAVQILIDGSPSRFAVLFHDVALGDEGALPVSRILRNLASRPSTEHRLLLNDGLIDLIERALSLANDELTDDDAIEGVLEATAGYRQKIGL